MISIVYIEINQHMESTSCKKLIIISLLQFQEGGSTDLQWRNEIEIHPWILSKGEFQCCQADNVVICCVSDSGHLLHQPVRAPGSSECGLPGVSVYLLTLPPPGVGVCQAPESPLEQGLAHANSLLDQINLMANKVDFR